MPNQNAVGLKPTETSFKYEDVRTSSAEAMIQNLISSLAKESRDASKGQVNIPDIKVTVTSLPFSNKFIPFLMILTPDALEDRPKTKDGRTEMAIFSSGSDGRLDLRPHIWAAIKPFIYTSKEKDLFRQPEYRKKLGMTNGSAGMVTSMISPRFLDDEKKAIIILLDPLKVFSALTDGGRGTWRDYDIVIESGKCKKIQGGEYSYTFEKTPKPKRKLNKDDIYGNITRLVANTMRRG